MRIRAQFRNSRGSLKTQDSRHLSAKERSTFSTGME
jgi:hypothetical protein